MSTTTPSVWRKHAVSIVSLSTVAAVLLLTFTATSVNNQVDDPRDYEVRTMPKVRGVNVGQQQQSVVARAPAAAVPLPPPKPQAPAPPPPPKQPKSQLDGSVKPAEGSSMECNQCALWAKESKDNQWSHEEYIRRMYVETVKMAATGYIIQTAAVTMGTSQRILGFGDRARFYGLDWPAYGYAMTGMARVNHLDKILTTAIREKIEGDFIECGVWRGGTSIVGRSVIVSLNSDKKTYVADSFQGLPKSTLTVDSDSYSTFSYLRVSLEQVRHHFERFHLYDPDKVIFIKGFFSESMPRAREQIQKLAVLRLDGDMYESCFDIINNLYDRLSVGGYLVVDDWNGFACKNAINILVEQELENYFRNFALPWELQKKLKRLIRRLCSGANKLLTRTILKRCTKN